MKDYKKLAEHLKSQSVEWLTKYLKNVDEDIEKIQAENEKLREALEWAVNRIEGINDEREPSRYYAPSKTSDRMNAIRALLETSK